MAMCRPVSGLPDQRRALIACARSSTYRSSLASRSAMSRKSRPFRASTGAIMIAGGLAARLGLKARFDQLTGDDRRDGQVACGVELRQPGAKPGIVPQPEDQV